MITAIDSLRKRISKAARFSAYLMLGTTISTTFAVADDPPAAASSSAHKLFVPMTQSARLRNYLAGLTGYQAILQSAAPRGSARRKVSRRSGAGVLKDMQTLRKRLRSECDSPNFAVWNLRRAT